MNIDETQEFNKLYNRNEVLLEGIRKFQHKAIEIAERNQDVYGLKDIIELMKEIHNKLEKQA